MLYRFNLKISIQKTEKIREFSNKISINALIFLTAFFYGIFGPVLFAESQDLVGSQEPAESPESLRAKMYFLMELEIFERDKLNRPSNRLTSADALRINNFSQRTGLSGPAGIKVLTLTDFSAKEKGDREGVSRHAQDHSQQVVFDPKNSSAVKSVFENDGVLLQWIKDNPELIYSAIQFGNLDLVRFFVENGGSINAARRTTHFSPLHFAVISFQPNIIIYFLDHPQTDLKQKSVWGDHLFHFVFLMGDAGKTTGHPGAQEGKSRKKQILDILFQPEYFPKISDLINTPNHHKETVLDFAVSDAMYRKGRIVDFLRDKGALLYKELEESRPTDTVETGCLQSFQQ